MPTRKPARPRRLLPASPHSQRAGTAATASILDDLVKDETSAKRSMLFQLMHSVVPRAAKIQIADLKRQMSMLKQQRSELETELHNQREAQAELRDTVDVLRSKLHSQGQREVDNMRRLAVHHKLEPLFDKLEETFPFKEPMEVVDRLEFLEDDKLGAFTQLADAQSEVAALEAALERQRKRHLAEQAHGTEASAVAGRRVQSANEELQRELAAANELIRAMKRREEGFLNMQNTAMNLWGRLEKHSDIVRKMREQALKDGIDNVEPCDPQQMLNAVQDATTLQVPSLAGQRLMEVSLISNKVWVQHFKDKQHLKNDSAKIFSEISKLVNNLQLERNVLAKQVASANESNKLLRESLSNLSLKHKILQNGVDLKAELRRRTAGVPRSEHDRMRLTLGSK